MAKFSGDGKRPTAPPQTRNEITRSLIGLDFGRALALAVLVVVTVSCTLGAPSKPPAASPSTPQLSPSPTKGPVANGSCPAANPQISTDKPLEALAASRTALSAERALQSFVDQYFDLKVVVGLPLTGDPDQLYFSNLDDSDLPILIAYGKLFICEWAKYSQPWVLHSHLRKVALVKNLINPYRGGCKLRGLAAWWERTMYLDILCVAVSGPIGEKHTLHHEFWHFVGASAHGGREDYVDPEWWALNPPGFIYGVRVWDEKSGWNPDLTEKHPRAGFVSAYALQNEQEDEAETYASVLVKELHSELVDYMTTDANLKGKVERLKQLIVAIDPIMNDSYLERAAGK